MRQRFSSAWVKDFPFRTLTHCSIAKTNTKTFSTEYIEDFPNQLLSVRCTPTEKPPTASAVGGFFASLRSEELSYMWEKSFL